MLVALAAAIGLAASACTSTDTSVTAPSADKCQVSVTGSPTSFDAGGGNGTVTVNAPRDCAWSAATNAGWVSINGARSGQGGASVSYSIAANPTGSARDGSIVVGSETVVLRQSGAPCRYTLSRSGDSIGPGGGRLSVDVSTLSGCSWSASTNASWMAISSGASGGASGTVSLSIAANGGGPRVGRLNVAGQIYTVNQDGAAPPPGPPSPSPSPSPSPVPSPTPAPPPPAPPPPSQHVNFSGIVFAVSGGCPNLTLNVSGRTVVTDNRTKFKDFKCNDVRFGMSVSVGGTADASGTVDADEIQKGDGHDH